MPHKNRKILKGAAGDLKGRLILVTLVLTGFAAQLAIIGPTSAPDSIKRDNEENIIEQKQAANIDAEARKKLKPLKVVSTSSSKTPKTDQAPATNSANPAIQGNPEPTSSSARKNQKNSKASQQEPERTTQRCLLFGRILCN